LEQTQRDLLEERAALLQQVLTQLTAEGQAKRVAVQEAEGRLRLLETEVEAATQQYRGASEQVIALQQRVMEEAMAHQVAEQALAQATIQLEQTQCSFLEERATLQQQLTQLTAEGQAKRVAVQETEGRLRHLETEAEKANQRYQSAAEQVAVLKQRVMEEATARQTAEETLTKVTTWLEQAKSRNRQLTTETIPELKSKLETQYSTVRDGRSTLEQTRLELRESRKALTDTTKQLQKARQRIEAAGHQLEKTRATSISFRLGYLLIHNCKSVKGLLSLPSALWTLRKETLQRRKKKEFVPSPTIVPAISRPSLIVPPPTTLAEPLSQELTSNGCAISSDIAMARRDAPSQGRLTVACIMDEFTFGSFQPEAQLHQLTPSHWRAELETATPDLLFIESAWRGKEDLWGNKVGHTSTELQGIVEWCRTQHIPTVFWCKEDPVHFETFLNTALLFDFVFTTDIDCIHRYKAALGHDRVYLLPFACQPATNNPIETYQRKDAFCFAGAYYVRYPEHTRDLGDFVLELPAFRPLEIYDRNYGKNDPKYQFPAEYRPYIVGTLPFDQIEKAYKGYRYAINLNSIKQSQSMFARRVFELLASNTITISNFSRGLRLLFGDLVLTTDSGAEVVRRLNKLADNEPRSRKFRLAGLRKVMSEHTYGQRLAYLVSKVSGKAVAQSGPHIAVLAYAGSPREWDAIQAHYHRQRYAHTSLYVVVGEGMTSSGREETRVHVVTRDQAKDLLVDGLARTADLVAGMVAEDYYGPNYLTDIALATRYTPVDLIGKAARYTWMDGSSIQLRHADQAYHPAPCLPARAAAIRRQVIAQENVLAWAQSLGTRQLQADQGLAIDEFNYCEQGAVADAALITEIVDDLPGLNTGLAIDDLLAIAERIAPESKRPEESPRLTGAQFAGDFGKKPSAAITLAVEGQNWRIDSTLPDGKHDYVYATADHSLDDLGVTERLKGYFEVTPGLNLQLAVLFVDAQKHKISHALIQANRNQEVVIPPGTVRIRFGLRVYASGQAEIQGLVLGHKNLQPAELIGQADHLLLTHQYPSYEDLYRNGFVHTRVAAYAARGTTVDVFRLRPDEAVSYHEFEDVNVISGSQEVLHRMLSSGRYQSVLVHFLDEAMWGVLQHHIERIKVFVWVHGFEIQPFHRRDNFENEQQRDKAKVQSKARMTFWRSLLRQMPDNLTLIFVSRYLAEVTMEDFGFRLPDSRYRIIHNAIDTDLFAHHKKSAEQRKKILSIRPYTSRTYANDLSVKAILALSEKPYFKDLEFRMVGDGKLFDEVLEPIRAFDNVHIERRFLTHVEIAAFHREYGIFLCPSRMDTQGVSRDEAMASGLVPVTNAVAAIPEFVDETCGMLAPQEDAVGLAESIAKLYHSPELFSAMSAAAAARVRRESSSAKTIDLELTLFTNNHI
jgi:glycosyltransferase involved in cell wall biosynthesis